MGSGEERGQLLEFPVAQQGQESQLLQQCLQPFRFLIIHGDLLLSWF